MSEVEAVQAARPWYRRRWLKVLTVAVVLVVGAFYYLFVDRYEVRKAADGWEFNGSFVRMRCPTCTGRVEHLACNGRVIVPPLKDVSQLPRMAGMLDTPVATLGLHTGERWRFYGYPHELFREESGQEITVEELHRGWYETTSDDSRRHRGTPAHWCRVQFGYACRWCDPEHLTSFDWAALAQTQPAGTAAH